MQLLYTKPFQTFFQRHEPDTILRDNGYLSFEGFAKYMMDKDNYAYLYEKTKHNDEVRLGQHSLSREYKHIWKHI